MRVEEMTLDQLRILIRETVEEKLEELLGDPDWSLELNESVRERLRDSLHQAEQGAPGVSIEDVVKKTGLRW